MVNGATVSATDVEEESPAAVGAIVVAGILMVLSGAGHIIQGIVALVNDDFYVVGSQYVFSFDLTSWGWVHIIAGVLVALAGAALFTGQMWARVVAVALATLSAIANFIWLPYYPLWAILVIAFDVFVIWAVVAHGREMRRI